MDDQQTVILTEVVMTDIDHTNAFVIYIKKITGSWSGPLNLGEKADYATIKFQGIRSAEDWVAKQGIPDDYQIRNMAYIKCE